MFKKNSIISIRNFKKIKGILPLFIGVLIGAGLTKNKAVLSILVGLIVVILIKRIIVYASKNKSEKQSTKKAIGITMINWYIGQVEAGFRLADKLYEMCYGAWVIVLNLGLLVFGINFLFKGNWLWAFVTLMSLQIIMTQNRIWRKLK